MPEQGRNAEPPVKQSLSNELSLRGLAPWIILTVIAAAVSYSPIVGNQLVNYDDGEYVLRNPFLRSLSLATVQQLFSTFYLGNYHPLTMLSLALDYQLGGLNPLVYHLTNVLLHLVNTLLVLILVLLLTRNRTIAVIAALLFGVHTIHVESVAWASARKDVLYTVWYLAALISYVTYIDGRRSLGRYALTLGLFGLSLFSKGQAVTLTVALILVDVLRKRTIADVRVIGEKLPFLALSVIFGVVALRAQQSAEALTTLGPTTIVRRALVAAYGYVMYLVKLVAPVGLSVNYPYPQQSLPLGYWLCLAGTGAVAALFLLSIKRRQPFVTFGIAFYTVTVAPVLQFIPVGASVMADRYAYLPSIGFCVIIGWVTERLAVNRPGLRKPALAVVAGYLLVLSALTMARTNVWHDSLRLWNDVLAKQPGSSIAYSNRAELKFNAGDLPGAIDDCNHALSINPRYSTAFFNRGSARATAGDFQSALSDFDRALEFNPRNVDAYYLRGLTFVNLGRWWEAIVDLSRYIKLRSSNGDAYDLRGTAKLQLGDRAGACSDFRAATMLGNIQSRLRLQTFCGK